MQGDDVKRGQHRMKRRGWYLNVNGEFDERTRGVCVALQHEKAPARQRPRRARRPGRPRGPL
jgi:hypothetical protein